MKNLPTVAVLGALILVLAACGTPRTEMRATAISTMTNEAGEQVPLPGGVTFVHLHTEATGEDSSRKHACVTTVVVPQGAALNNGVPVHNHCATSPNAYEVAGNVVGGAIIPAVVTAGGQVLGASILADAKRNAGAGVVVQNMVGASAANDNLNLNSGTLQSDVNVGSAGSGGRCGTPFCTGGTGK